MTDDTIYRQAAIEAMCKWWCNMSSAQDDDFLGILEELPSAQTEIIHCRDCKWKDRHNCTRAVEVWIDDDKFCAWAERRET